MSNKLGARADDRITGFTGVITGKAEYLTGCDQYLVQPSQDDKTKYPDAQWFDKSRLIFGDIVIEPGYVQIEDDPGCDYIAPKK